MPCGKNEVVVGIQGVGSDLDAGKENGTVWGIGVLCAHLGLRQTASGYAVDVFPDTKPPGIVGGNITGPPPSFAFTCPQTPEPTIVSEVSGNTWKPDTFTENLNVVRIGCSTVRVDASMHVTVDPPILTKTVGASREFVRSFALECHPSGAANGIRGRSGAYIDAFSVSCGTLSVEAH
jgi:hypothetical protein